MLKVGLITVLLAIELTIYYIFGGLASYPFRVLGYGFLIFWYYSIRKNSINLTDKLFLITSSFAIISPIPAYILAPIIGNLTEFFLIMIGHVFIILIFRIEGSKIKFFDKQNTFVTILIPYILMPFAFFVAVILPIKSLLVVFVTGIYLLEMVYLLVLSAFVPFSEKGKLYISLSMLFLVLASGANAYRTYITDFGFNYGVVRVSTSLFRLFLLLGMLYRNEK